MHHGYSVSAVTIGFNCWHYLESCLRSLNASAYPLAEIIVVDNASRDGTVEKLQSGYPRVRLIQNAKNLGHARAVNQGFQAARGIFVLLLDADTELAADTLELMVQFLVQRPEVEVVSPRTFNTDGSLQQTARNFPSVINGVFGRRSVLTRLFPKNPFSKKYLAAHKYDNGEPFHVEQVSASCMLIRKSLLDRVGMWDQEYHSYWVDTDFCKRVAENNGLIYCLPKATIVHHEQNKPFARKSPLRIISFHTGAFRFYRLHKTYGYIDPRCWAAMILLTVRAALLLVVNCFSKKTQN